MFKKLWQPKRDSITQAYGIEIKKKMKTFKLCIQLEHSFITSDRKSNVSFHWIVRREHATHQAHSFWKYRKTPLISTHIFLGLTTEQVLIFGAVLTFGGYDKAEWKILQGRSLFNPMLSAHNTLLSMFQPLCTYFQETGYLYAGVCTFGALQPTVNFSKNWRGTYFRRGTYLRGFTVVFNQILHD